MYQLCTEPEKFAQIADLVAGSARNPTDGDVYFNAVLSRLNLTNEIITLASSTGQPYVKSKQMMYIHMAVTKEGAEMVVNLFQQLQRRLYDDYTNDNQPLGVALKPAALQIRFNYYLYNDIWHQAMTLQCHGITDSMTQNYLVQLMYEAN